MRKQVTNTRSERQLKFAEAGILFVLILGIALFVGTKMSAKDSVQESAQNTVQESGTELQVTLGETDPVVEEIRIDPAGVIDPLEESIEFVDSEIKSEDQEPQAPRVVTYALAEEAYLAGHFEEATEMFAIYTQEHSLNAWGHYMEGLSNWKAGEPDTAEEAFIAALDIQPDHLKSLVNYGRVLLELDRADEAKVQLEAAVAISPQSVDANRVLGRANHNLGLLEEAAVCYRTALAIKIDDIWSLNNLGLIRIEQGKFDEALPPLAKAVQLRQDIACIQNNLGVALERNGYLKDSALAFEKALVADAQYAKAEESLSRINALVSDEDSPVLDLEFVATSFSETIGQTAEVEEVLEADQGPVEPVIEVASGENSEL